MVFSNTAATNISNELHNMVFQNWGAPLNFGKPSCGLYKNEWKFRPSILENLLTLGTLAVFGGLNPKKLSQIFLRLRDAYKKYFLQKKWVKTAIPALSSGQSNLHPPIWGRHRQLDDQHRNPNSNDRDHLVGQLTSVLVTTD